MLIIGAGMAGLIAANVLRHQHPVVLEAQPAIPNNHKALLRFRTRVVGEAVGIDFHPVFVRKAIVHDENFLDAPNPYACNMYSRKVTGKVLDRSIWDVSPGVRYIAPDDFISRLAKGADVKLSTLCDGRFIKSQPVPIISTIPMPILMDVVGWRNKPKFEYHHIWAVNATVVEPLCDIHQTLYFTSQSTPLYRATITGNKLTCEYIYEPQKPLEMEVAEVLDFFGITGAVAEGITKHKQQFGKILPIDESVRNDFIYTMTQEFGIYSLGRYATWRQILLDDLVKDIRVIQGLVDTETSRRMYAQNLHKSRRAGDAVLQS